MLRLIAPGRGISRRSRSTGSLPDADRVDLIQDIALLQDGSKTDPLVCLRPVRRKHKRKDNLRKTILLLGPVISICGCMPQTSSHLVETATTTQKFCYTLPREEVEHLLESILRECFHHPSRPGGSDDIFEVNIEELPNMNRYSLSTPVGIGFSADVTGGSGSCETEVQMYAAFSTWERTITDIGEAIHDEEVRCPSKHLL